MQISLKLLLVAFWGVLTLTVKSNAQESSPQAGNLESLWDAERVLDNPHKGLYHHFYANSTGAYGWLGQDVQVYPGLKYLYIRLAWSYFEPYDDQYDWHLIDEVVEQYWPQGYKIALSITAKETDHAVHWGGEELNQVVDGVVYATPKWVRDAGARGQVVDNWGAQHWEPRYDDPVFLDKLDEFHAALAARYDGKPYVEYFGMGSIGEWGEGHTGFSSGIVPSVATVKAHLDIYTRHYQQTPIEANDDYLYWRKSESDAAELKAYFEERGIWFSDHSVMVEWWVKDGASDTYGVARPQLFADNYRQRPTIIESHHYGDWVETGLWCTPNGANCPQYGADWLMNTIETIHPTYFSFQGYPEVVTQENPEFVKQVANKVGYWYFIRNLGWNTGKRAGEEWYFWAEWLNRGVAPAYHPYQLSVRLEGPVTKTFIIADARNRDWLDGKNHWETYSVKLPADMPGGDYQVKLKLYDPRTQRDVDLGFKTSIKDKDGYFKLGNVALEAPLTGSGSITPGTYQLLARHSDKALDVRKRSANPGANVQQWAYAGTPNQQWQITSAGNGYYTLKAKHSVLALSVDLAADPATADGVNIFQYGTNEQDNRLWKIEPVGEGYYKLINKYSGKVLDVAGGVETNGANVIQWQYKSGANQQWKLVPVNANARTASSQKQTSTEKIETPDLRLYPNPAHAQLMMEAADNKDYQLTVYDLTGRLMMQQDHLKGKASLDISRLRPGVYIVKMSDGVHPQLRQRIIVE